MGEQSALAKEEMTLLQETRDKSQLDAADGQKEVRAIASLPSGSIPYSAKSYLVAFLVAMKVE